MRISCKSAQMTSCLVANRAKRSVYICLEKTYTKAGKESSRGVEENFSPEVGWQIVASLRTQSVELCFRSLPS